LAFASARIWSGDGSSSAATLSTSTAISSARRPCSLKSRTSVLLRSAACGGLRPLTCRMLPNTTPAAMPAQMPSAMPSSLSTTRCLMSCGSRGPAMSPYSWYTTPSSRSTTA
jgi:hypothetical protein